MRNVKKQLLKLLALSGNSRTRWTKSELGMDMDAAFIDAYFGGSPPPVPGFDLVLIHLVLIGSILKNSPAL